MVFRGKPSGACLPCRQRRIKCDLDPAGCGSCRRMGVTCTGYRDTSGLRFCHETEPIVKKVKAKKNNASKSASPPAPQTLPEDDAEATLIVQLPTRPNPPPSLDQFAMTWFHGHYGTFTHLLTPSTLSDSRAALQDCVKALGLATCANVENASDLGVVAQRYYVSALAKTNAVLRASTCARDDATLYAVMILTNFETVNRNDQSQDAWRNHISGSNALLTHRGTKQLKSATGRMLFMQCVLNLLSSCIRSASRVPPELYELTFKAAESPDPKSFGIPIWTIQIARLNVTDLYSDIVNGRISDFTAAIRKMLDTDRQIVQAFSEFPPEPSPTQPYRLIDLFQSQGLVAVQICRIMIHLTLVRLLRDAETNVLKDLDKQALLSESITCLGTLAFEVLSSSERQLTLASDPTVKLSMSSAPGFLSAQAAVSNAASAMADLALVAGLAGHTAVDFTADDPPVLRLSHGYLSIWAPLLIAQMSAPGSATRKAACETLHSIGRAFKVQQATILAERFESIAVTDEG